MTKLHFAKGSALGAALLALLPGATLDAQAQEAMKVGDVLTGQLNAMRVRGPKGKRVPTYQLVSAPRRLPPPADLCNLETGPQTFQIVTSGDGQAAQLKSLVGKQVSLKVDQVSCAEEAGQMSEALVTKWSIVAKP